MKKRLAGNWNHFSIAYMFFHLLLQLLRESEATSMRLTEQAKVLKEEIRRYATIATWLKNVFCTFSYCKEFVLQLQNRGFQNLVDSFRVSQYPIMAELIQMFICFLFQRLERNQEREKESANLEYLKNVILQFLKCRPSEREHLVPVLTTMLKLSQDEKDLVIQQARGIV